MHYINTLLRADEKDAKTYIHKIIKMFLTIFP